MINDINKVQNLDEAFCLDNNRNKHQTNNYYIPEYIPTSDDLTYNTALPNPNLMPNDDLQNNNFINFIELCPCSCI